MSLRERMKMFENKNSGRTLPRETVTQAERASDIRSKISSWGQGASSNQYHVSLLIILLKYSYVLHLKTC